MSIGKPISKEFAVAEMQKSGDILHKWSQCDNLVLKNLAIEIITIAEGRP